MQNPNALLCDMSFNFNMDKLYYKDETFNISMDDALEINNFAETYKFISVFVNKQNVMKPYEIKIYQFPKIDIDDVQYDSFGEMSIIPSTIEEYIHICMDEEMSYINANNGLLSFESGIFYYKIPFNKYIVIEHINDFDNDFGKIYACDTLQYPNDVVMLDWNDETYHSKLNKLNKHKTYICTYYVIPNELKNIKYHATMYGQKFD